MRLKHINKKTYVGEFSATRLRKRLSASLLAIASIFLALFGRTFYLQVIDGDALQAKALDQWTRELPIVAERGLILDRNMTVIVDNTTAYSVFVRPRNVTDAAETARVLAEIFGIDAAKTAQKISKKTVSEYTLVRQTSEEKIAELSKYELDGVYFSKDNVRNYPYGEFLTQALGYVSSDNSGQSGLEMYYDELLRGTDGELLYQTDLLGAEIDGKPITIQPSVGGMDLRLTIDIGIQLICESAMDVCYRVHSPKRAEALVLDVTNGEILAMASRPSYDLNDVPRDDAALLNSLSRNGLAVDTYEPGSTFKVLTAAADIEETLSGNNAAFTLDHIFGSDRYRYVDGRRIKCWSEHKNGKHSNQTLSDALNNSCNPCFVDIALALGRDTMYDYLEKFGYGTRTGIDFPGEAYGTVLPKGSITNGDLARISFGQTIAVTPLQLACATASAVNGGYYYRPHLLKAVYKDGAIVERVQTQPVGRTISERASKILAGYLERVVSEGSGKQAFIEGARVGGKTGTAQKYENGMIAQGKYVASFVGFFPADNPKYLALVIVDEPEGQYFGSTVAAPYAKRIFEGIISMIN